MNEDKGKKVVKRTQLMTPYNLAKEFGRDAINIEQSEKIKRKEELVYDDGGYCSSHTITEDIDSPSKHSVKEKANEHITPLLQRGLTDTSLYTIFFPYPKCCSKIRNPERTIPMTQEFKLKYKITDSVYTYNCVLRALDAAGFIQTEGLNWNILWSAPLHPEMLKNFSKYQRCNHFPGTWQLGRKDNLWRNLVRYVVYKNI